MTNMYKIISLPILFVIGLVTENLFAQTYIPVSVSGFNHDLIANGSGGANRAAATTTTTFDNVNVGGDNVMYSRNFRGNNNQNSEPPFGLPDNGIINSVNLIGANYQLAPYDQNNALVLKTNGSSGTLILGTPGVFSKIAFLGSSAEGVSGFSVILNFSDGTNTTSNFSVPDWYNGSGFAFKGLGRVSRTQIGNQAPDVFTGDSENPRLYDNQITLGAPFNSKILTSITFTKTSSTGNTAILAINGITPVNAPAAPIASAATNINGTNFTANWLSVANATNYFLDVSDSPSFITLMPGYNNRDVGNVLSFNVTGLPNGPVYYYRVRARNISGVSPSSNTIEVCLMPLPTAVCNNISVPLNNLGNYTLTQIDLNAIGNGSKDNCGSPNDITLAVNQNTFSCTDLVLGQPNNYAVELDGVNDFIQSDATNVLKILPLTVEAWVKPALRTEITDFYPNNVLSNDNPGLFGHGFGANINNSVNQITIEYQNSFRIINNAGLSSDTWQHIAVVYTPGNVKTYVNGLIIDNFNYPQSGLTGTGSFWIGKHNDDGTYGTRRFYKGQLDEVRVWHRALSGAEILANKNTTSVGNESDLKLYYTFEDGPGSSKVKDILGNADANFQADMNPQTSWVSPGAPVTPAVLGTSVILTVTNNKGNKSTCNATVSVEDITPPVAKCPTTSPTVVLDNAGNGVLAANALALGNSTDNCPTDLVETSPAMNFTCADVAGSTVILTATDASGNTGTCTAAIQIVDNIPPVAKCPATPPTVVISVNGPAMLTANALAGGNSTDNCSAGLIENSPARSFTCTDAPSALVSLTATDVGGNKSTVSCSVNINDAAKPTAIINSGGRTVLEDANPTITLNASGSTGAGNTPLQFRWSDGTTGTTTIVSFAGVYTLTVTNTLNGCSSVTSITITDNRSNLPGAPQATAATNVSLQSFTANWLPGAGASTYVIDVSESSSFQTFIGSYNNFDAGNVVSFGITGLTKNTTYYYRIRALNIAGSSPYSNIIEVKTLEQGSSPVLVTGFNQDIIAEGAGGTNRALATTTTDIGTFVLYSKDFRGNNNPNTAPAYGLPADGFINNASTPGINYQLASYTGNNALVLKTLNQTGTLTLPNPAVYSAISVLGTSEGSLTKVNITLEFSDGSMTSVDADVRDWFNGQDFAIKGIGRMLRNTDVFSPDESTENPRLYNIFISIPTQFANKPLRSLGFIKTSGSGSTVILGVNGTSPSCNLAVEVTADGIFCEGNAITFTSNVSDAAQYTWTSPSGFPLAVTGISVIQNAKPEDSGIYTLDLVMPDNCKYSASIDLDINPLPVIRVEEEGSPCGSDTIILNENGGDAITWLWNGPGSYSSTSPNVVLVAGIAQDGVYELSVTDINGCTNTFFYELEFIDGETLDGNFLVSAGACAGDTILVIDYSLFDEILSTISFSWDFGDGRTSLERDPVVVYNSSGNYTITLNVESVDCSLTIQKNIEILDCRKEDMNTTKYINFYPNPSMVPVQMSARLPVSGDVALKIYDSGGQEIHSKYFTEVQNFSDELPVFRPGIYFADVIHATGRERHKLVVF